MYTKPVDVNQPHSFSAPKHGVTYEPIEWTAFFDRREKLNDIVPVYFAGN